jgi:GNAT superfamily N-acetyltransferase
MTAIVEIGRERLEELRPLVEALDAHHREVAGHLERIAPRLAAGQVVAGALAHYAATLADEPRAFILVAEAGARLTGFTFVAPRDADGSYELGGRTAELGTLVVLPEARGNGVGEALLTAAREEAARRGFPYMTFGLMDGNEAARRFYERAGAIPALHVYWLPTTTDPGSVAAAPRGPGG